MSLLDKLCLYFISIESLYICHYWIQSVYISLLDTVGIYIITGYSRYIYHYWIQSVYISLLETVSIYIITGYNGNECTIKYMENVIEAHIINFYMHA